MKKPLIGIILDYENKTTKEGGYSDFPWYAIRTHYEKAVAKHGGIPLLIPYQKGLINEYVKIMDGFVFPGGEYDIDPSYYGEAMSDHTVISTDDRTNFELALMSQVLLADKPMLGICAGQQLLNVLLGGNLYQDINDEVETKVLHKHKKPQDANVHDIKILEGTVLRGITGCDSYKVNSHHHQAVKNLGKDLVVCAIAEDGVIEAIEHKHKKFCIGVEWHPEYEKNEQDSLLFSALISKASDRSNAPK